MEELEDLSTNDALSPYKQGDFLVSEYSAVMKYGDISDWLKENQTEEPFDAVIESEEVTVEVKPRESTPEEVPVPTETADKRLKHGKGSISLK